MDSLAWVLLGLRFEFHLLAHAFKRDLNDADRPGSLSGLLWKLILETVGVLESQLW